MKKKNEGARKKIGSNTHIRTVKHDQRKVLRVLVRLLKARNGVRWLCAS